MKRILLGIISILLFSQTTYSRESYIGCYYYDLENFSLGRASNLKYTYALDQDQNYLKVKGHDEEEFFFINDKKYSFNKVVELCQKSIPKGLEFYKAEAFNHWYDFYPKTLGNDEFYKMGKLAIKKMILFGDSISDTGNLHKWARVVPTEAYWNGHFTNGWVWIQYLSHFLNDTPHLNWSYAGMKTSNYSVTLTESTKETILDFLQKEITGNFKTELKKYIKSNRKNTKGLKNNLYFIWLGANNYFNLLGNINYMKQIRDEWNRHKTSSLANHYAKLTTDDIISGIEGLIKIGGKKFFVIDLPDLGLLPLPVEEKYLKYMNNLSHLSALHNEKLKRKIEALQIRNPNVKIHLFQAKELFQTIRQNPQEFGLTNVTDSCFAGDFFNGKLSQVCSTPHEYLFFDLAHPNSRVHCFLANRIQQEMRSIGLINEAVPAREDVFEYCLRESARIYKVKQ